jgi:hypothetical protein
LPYRENTGFVNLNDAFEAPPKPLNLEDLDDDVLMDDFEMVDDSNPELENDDWIEVDAALQSDSMLDLSGLQQKQDRLSQAITKVRLRLGLAPREEPPASNLDPPLSPQSAKRADVQRLADEMARLKQKFAEMSRKRAELSDNELEAMLKPDRTDSLLAPVEPPSLIDSDLIDDGVSPGMGTTSLRDVGSYGILERPDDLDPVETDD